MKVRFKLMRAAILLSALTTVKTLQMNQNTTYNESLAVSDVKQNFYSVLNKTETSISAMLLFRYPTLLQMIVNIVDNESLRNISSFNEYELCKIAEENLQKSKDRCEKPFQSQSVRLKCDNSTEVPVNTNSTGPKNSSFYDICQQFILTTTSPVLSTKPLKTKRMRQLVKYPLIHGASRNRAKYFKYSSTNVSTIKRNNVLISSISHTLPKVTPTSNFSNRSKVANLFSWTTKSTKTTKDNQTTSDIIYTTQITTRSNQTTLGGYTTGSLMPKSDEIAIKTKFTNMPQTNTKTLGRRASNYFFLAIKVMAKTIIVSNERKCRNRNGIFDQKKNICREPSVSRKSQYL